MACHLYEYVGVCVKIAKLDKHPTTHITPEWLLTCMSTPVSVKNLRLAKGLATRHNCKATHLCEYVCLVRLT